MQTFEYLVNYTAGILPAAQQIPHLLHTRILLSILLYSCLFYLIKYSLVCQGQSGRIGTMRDGGTLQKYFFETKKFHIFSLQIKLSTL